jgi:uncharacterized protein (DUF2141 family)
MKPGSLSLALLLAGFLSSPVALAADFGAIVVDIRGFKNDKGLVRLDVFNDDAKFDKMDHKNSGALRSLFFPIKSREARITIEHLDYGEYAIRFFHDEDNSEKFYTNLIGIPKVEYGFSNNARGHFGPPKYKEAKFLLDSNEKQLKLNVMGAK